jgi:hypothetical protein
MKAVQSKSSTSHFGTIRLGIVLLTLASAAIHISLLFPDPMFILNGIGFLVLLAAYILPLSFLEGKKDIICWAFIGYTALTIAAWIALGDKSMLLGYFTKGIEILLIILLLADQRR